MLAKNHTKTSRTKKKNMAHYSITRRALFTRIACKSRCKGWVDDDELILEAVAQTCSVKKVFLEVSQNSQANTCAWLTF